MKKILTLSAIIFCSSGCARLVYERTDKDGEKVKTVVSGLFMNSSISKLQLDNQTEKSRHGLAVGGIQQDVNTEAIKAAGDVVSQVTAAAVQGAVKGATKAVVP